jgi:hypothetical protein
MFLIFLLMQLILWQVGRRSRPSNNAAEGEKQETGWLNYSVSSLNLIQCFKSEVLPHSWPCIPTDSAFMDSANRYKTYSYRGPEN